MKQAWKPGHRCSGLILNIWIFAHQAWSAWLRTYSLCWTRSIWSGDQHDQHGQHNHHKKQDKHLDSRDSTDQVFWETTSESVSDGVIKSMDAGVSKNCRLIRPKASRRKVLCFWLQSALYCLRGSAFLLSTKIILATKCYIAKNNEHF